MPAKYGMAPTVYELNAEGKRTKNACVFCSKTCLEQGQNATGFRLQETGLAKVPSLYARCHHCQAPLVAAAKNIEAALVVGFCVLAGLCCVAFALLWRWLGA